MTNNGRMSPEAELEQEDEVEGKKPTELGMAGWHPKVLPVTSIRPRFLEISLQHHVNRLIRHLAREEGDGPQIPPEDDQGREDHQEGDWEQRGHCKHKSNRICRLVFDLGESKGHQRRRFHVQIERGRKKEEEDERENGHYSGAGAGAGAGGRRQEAGVAVVVS